MTKCIEHIFCPKCKSMNLENESNATPEWVSDDVVGSTECYVCARCGHEFKVATSYVLSDFYFLDEEDDSEYRIIKED